MRRKDGSEIWVEDHGRYVHDEQGNIVYHEGILRDITERKRLEEELKQHSLHLEKLVDERTKKLQGSETKYRQLVELAREGVWLIDKDSYTTFVNPRMAEMLGYTTEEMIGKHLFSFMDEHGVELARLDVERRKQGIREQIDFEFRRKDGTLIYTILETNPITDDKGNYVGALAVVADITERKRMEEELRTAKNRLELVVTSNPAAIYSGKPIADYSDWHLTYLSDRVTSMVGFEPQKFIGHHKFWENHVHPDDLCPTLAAIPGFSRREEVRSTIVLYTRMEPTDGYAKKQK